jgi:L-ascorbate metabolism protein UlaG (beta-lactamase superfamily)
MRTKMGSFLFQIWRLFLLSFVSFFSLTCAAPKAEQSKPHHTKDGFRNVYIADESRFSDFLKWRWNRMGKDIPGREDYDFPLAKNDPAFLRSNKEKVSLTWIGHATVLLQMKGKNILTDPHFSKRASPVQWAGPERVIPPGIPLQELPPIHMVVISHDHYDSLDEQTIAQLHQRDGGEKTLFLVPHTEADLKITAVPLQHWSQRGLLSRDRTLWAGWVIQATDFRFFFAGDTGYAPHFKEIGHKLGPFDLSAIPIGAYEPRWFMRNYHINPEEALQIHLDVRSKKSVAIHWGTFILTDEPLDEPPKRLEEARRENGRSEEEFLILRHGEIIVLD